MPTPSTAPPASPDPEDQWLLRWMDGREKRLPLREVIELLRASSGRTLWTGRVEREGPVWASPPGTRQLLPVQQIPALRAEWIATQERAIGAGKRIYAFFAGCLSLISILELLANRNPRSTIFIVLAVVLWVQVVREHRRQRRFSSDLAMWEAIPQAVREMQARWNIGPLRRDSRAWWLVIAMLLVGLVQLWLGGQGAAPLDPNAAIHRAGLLKPLPNSEWWRLWTAPLLHGSVIHWVVNCSALLSLAALIDGLCRRWWTPLVWMLGALGGTVASVLGSKLPSVGASGGIAAMLGFLLILGLRLRPVLPWLLTSMVQTLVVMVLLGVVLHPYIDNFAHAGGLSVGILLGVIHPLNRLRQHGPSARHAASAASRMTSRVIDGVLVTQLVWTVSVLI